MDNEIYVLESPAKKGIRTMNPVRTIKAAGVLALLIFIGVSHSQASTDPFPMPEEITANVDFWTKVYAQYTTSQGIVHDNTDLDIIYEIIDLLPYDYSGAGKINRKRMKRANEKYERILWRLAKSPNASDQTSRRVAALFPEPHDVGQFRKAARRVRCQVGQKDRFQAGLIRSGAYLEQIRSIFLSQGMPEDLAYLPHVESSFNPNAYSKFGAAGIWQFTRSTGKRFMEVGYTLDERRDPILATYAAAELLKENYEKLGGWALAVTAYNHGAAGMQRAQNIHGDYANIFRSYRSRTFKFASRNFYAEFLAARQVASNYQDYFGDLELAHPLPSHTTVLKGYASFDDLSQYFQVDPHVLKQMNPALRQPVVDGQKYIPKGYTLRLPIRSNLGQTALMAAIPDAFYQKVQKPSRFYTVQRGDTAGNIARMHRVDLSDLILANNLNRRATIYPRQTLRIPTTADQPTPVVAPAVETSEPIIVAKVEQNFERAAFQEAEVPVQTENELKTERYPQPILASVIPLPRIDSADQPSDSDETANLQARNEQIVTADVGFDRLYEVNGRPVGIIQVEVEETLGHYAEWAKVRTQQIRNLNRFRFGSVLHLHQDIKIPLHRTDAPTFEQNRYEYHKRLQEDFFAVYRIGELQPYKVERGDTYWTLCRDKFEIPMWLLKHCNPEVDLADLRTRQSLVIPTIEKASTDDADSESGEEDAGDGEGAVQTSGGV